MDHPIPEKSAMDAAKLEEKAGHAPPHGGLLGPDDVRAADGSSLRSGEDILALQDVDPVLNMKMHLVNNVSAYCWFSLPWLGLQSMPSTAGVISQC
jgi:hypothetical protein